MIKNRKIKLGLFGFGCVGQGLYNVLSETRGIQAEIVKICIKDPSKPRSLAQELFTTDRDEILENPEVDVVVEMITEHDAARDIAFKALKNGKSLVTANKKMIGDNLTSLIELQRSTDKQVLYEGACCASIPIIRNLEEYYDNDLVNALNGIFNGTTNYILTRVFDRGESFDDVLKAAIENGFAEADPTADITGEDAKYKLTIILTHAFGIIVPPWEVRNFGIDKLNDFDIKIARQRGTKFKLKAMCRKIGSNVHALVVPQFVDREQYYYRVDNEFNCVSVEGAFSEHQHFIGKGAGSFPTGSAVLSDISALTYDYKYEYKKIKQNLDLKLDNNFLAKFYVRFSDSHVNINDFVDVEEIHHTKTYNYVIGTINFSKLIESDWIKNPDTFIAMTEDSEILEV